MKKNSSKNDIKVPETDDNDLKKQIENCISSVDADNCVEEKSSTVIHDIEKVQKVVQNVANEKEEIQQGEIPVNNKEKPNGVIPETEKVVKNIKKKRRTFCHR